MNHVMCPECGQIVPYKRFCSCGAELLARGGRSRIVAFENRAGKMKEELQRIKLVHAQIVRLPGGGAMPRIKPLHVPQGQELFVYSSLDAQPRRLQTGTYTAAQWLPNQGIAGRVGVEGDEDWCMLGFVRTQTLRTVFSLPDEGEILEQDESAWTADGVSREAGKACEPGETSSQSSQAAPENRVVLPKNEVERRVRQALTQLSLVDSNGRFGGVTVQMFLRCANPEQLIETAIPALLGGVEGDESKSVNSEAGPSGTVSGTKESKPIRGLLADAMRALFRRKKGSSILIERSSFTFWDLYNQFRLEFKDAVRLAVRYVTAEQLYDDAGVKEQVENDFRNTMAQTLDHYGLVLERVSHFNFICPELEDLREARGRHRHEEERLEDRERQADITRRDEELKKKVKMRDLENQGEVARAELKEDGATREASDSLLAQAQERKLAMQARQGDHRRSEKALEECQETALRKERGLAELDLKQRKLDDMLSAYEEKRRIDLETTLQLAQALRGMDPQQVLLFLVHDNPQLAPMYVQSQRALGEKRQTELLRELYAKVADAHGQSSRQVAGFWREATRLFGAAVGRDWRKQPGRVGDMATHIETEPPQSLPPSDEATSESSE